jgi:ABC-2 type transport system ATP-binding protein
MARKGGAILADGLRKRFRDNVALDGFHLDVPAGTVHGMLGPNGAGKTTAVRILATLLRPDAGRAEVAGADVVRRPADARRRLGLVGQHPALDEVLSGHHNLVMFGRLSHLPRGDARRRAEELLERFGLTDAATRQVKHYSGGMRRRLDIAAGLLLRPAVLFLDEPTTGLDPRGRNEVWEAVRALVADGTTVLLTTQLLDEADHLADAISVIDHGRVIAEGTPHQLKGQLGGDRVEVILRRADQIPAAAEIVARAAGERPLVDADARRIRAQVADRVAALTAVARALDERGVEAEDVAVRRPTLDEVFLHLTGHRTEATVERDREVMA